MFMLRVENTTGQPPQRQNGRFKTTKQDKKLHRLGLAGMEEIAHRYGGSLEAAAHAGHFELVCLPLSSGAAMPALSGEARIGNQL